MNDKIQLAPPSSCTGCGVCVDACPTKSIDMKIQGLLHFFPLINYDTCILCGKCQKMCPILTPLVQKESSENYYAAWSADSLERKEGTSGGLGSAFARFAIDRGWVVVGAAFDDNWQLNLRLATTKDEIQKFKGSKYLHSRSDKIFKKVYCCISNGQKVLFIGTPCQIEAIKKFIPISKQYMLITCGIICHGVNSPVVWKDYVRYLEKTSKSKLVLYNFRSKVKGWGQDKRGNIRLYVSYLFSNGKNINEPAWKNLFHHWFGMHLIMRECCFHCPFRKEHRNSDLTIGDFWGVQRILSELPNMSDGVSVVVTSTEKGEKFISECVNIEKIKVNSELTKKELKGYLDLRSEKKKNYEIFRMKKFSSEYENLGFGEMKNKYPAPTSIERIIKSIKFHLGIK